MPFIEPWHVIKLIRRYRNSLQHTPALPAARDIS
jgi:hypothetical protein